MLGKTSISLFALALLGKSVICQANKPYSEEEKKTALFLQPLTKVRDELVSKDDIRLSLLNEVEETLGTGSASKRLAEIEIQLKPLIAALPKNHHGNLGHSGVRYALHRLFVLRHGWVIKGLSPEGDAQNSSSPSGVLKDQVPAYLERLFEQRLAGKGFTLHELSVLAATIEHLIHNEASSRLAAAFTVSELSMTSPITQEEAKHVLDIYMMAYILGEDLSRMDANEAGELKTGMPEVFMAWNETMDFVEKVRKQEAGATGENTFASLAKVVDLVGEQFGSFQDRECRELKDKLVNMEYRGTGRVKLSDFYKPALDGTWTFQESAGYLRALGLLDESDPMQPTVMISNYLISKSNCIASSGFYSVCCKDECEGLLGHLEQSIRKPEAAPSVIADLVGTLSSSTVSMPADAFKKSPNLLQRLEEIASNHDGLVPLHGRLFAQWMHHVFPRECPYPHISGTTQSKLPDEWMDESGYDSTASDDEMMQYVSQTTNTSSLLVDASDLPVEELTPWSPEEELVIVRPSTAEELLRPTASLPAAVRSMMLFAAAGSLAAGLVRSMKNDLHKPGMPNSNKYFV